MFPVIDKKQTGVHLRMLMDRRGFSVKDIQEYLGLASVQSVYHWLNGISMPTIDNLYALSELFQVTVDDMICGNKTVYTISVRRLSSDSNLWLYTGRNDDRVA